MSSQTFSHPSLGSLTGTLAQPTVLQFRSIPYGRIPVRFQQAEMINDLGSDQGRTFTSHGPACPQKPQGTEWWGGPLPGEKERMYDEFGCLTLTLSMPARKENMRGSDHALPVLVYVHGGGLVEGMGSGCPRHDMSKMVELSMQEEQPVVCVSINYRVNYFGFLACQDLLEESTRLSTPFSNFGLHDQRLALLWIQSHISGFGGSPSNVTVFGESAGSVSLFLHMCSSVPLFRNAILMSGTVATIPVANLDDKEKEYMELLSACGIDQSDPDRLNKLRDVPADCFVRALTDLKKAVAHPVWDGGVVGGEGKGMWHSRPTYLNQAQMIAECEWVQSVVIGEAFSEGFISADWMKLVTADKLTNYYPQVLGEADAKKLLGAYEISPAMDNNLCMTRAMTLAGDLLLSEPMHALTSALSALPIFQSNKRLYHYTTTIRHPFPGTTSYQVPGPHAIDLFFVFANLLARLPTGTLRQTSLEFAKRWIAFANGHDAWPRYHIGDAEKIAVVDGREGWAVRTREEDERVSAADEQGGRRYRQWDVIGEVMRGLGEGEEMGRRALIFAALT